MFTPSEIKALRKDTPGCSHRTHLNSAGASLQPQAVINAVRDYMELEAITGGYETANQQSNRINAFYPAIAKLLNCYPRNVAFAHNATDAYTKALSSIPFKEGDVILTTDDDYASNQIAFLFLQKRHGVKLIRAAKRKKGGVDVDSVRDLIKKHSPKLVAVTHVPTNSGLVQPVYKIGAMCKEKEIWYLVDACQSAGQLELDVQRMGCDFLSATMRKFLRGPRGAGFLYASDRALESGLEPVFPDLHGATWIGANEYQLSKTAKRFEYWERNYAFFLGATEAANYATDLGLDKISKRVQENANYARKKIEGISDFKIMDKGKKLCGIVTAHSSKRNWQALKKSFSDNKFNVSVVTVPNAFIDLKEKGVDWLLRVSPHYFNTKEEIDALVSHIKKFDKV